MMIVSDEVERILKEVIMDCFGVLSIRFAIAQGLRECEKVCTIKSLTSMVILFQRFFENHGSPSVLKYDILFVV
jgi:hypothetical protein